MSGILCICCGSPQTQVEYGEYDQEFIVCNPCDYSREVGDTFGHHLTTSTCPNRTQEEIEIAKIALSSRYGKTAQNRP
jgi:hypothetical protein